MMVAETLKVLQALSLRVGISICISEGMKLHLTLGAMELPVIGPQRFTLNFLWFLVWLGIQLHLPVNVLVCSFYCSHLLQAWKWL